MWRRRWRHREQQTTVEELEGKRETKMYECAKGIKMISGHICECARQIHSNKHECMRVDTSASTCVGMIIRVCLCVFV